MNDWLDLKDKRVLVAGVGGLGAALCAGFEEVGARLHLVDRDSALIERTLQQLSGVAQVTEADLSTRRGAESAVAETVVALGGLDVLVHAVGINIRELISDIDEESWSRTQDVNAASFLWLAKAARPHLVDGGRIVAISSVSGSLAHPHHGSYAASKGALNQLVRVMAIEWADEGIAVNAVAPAYIITPLTEDYVAKPGQHENLISKVPMKRLGRPEDVVGPVLLLSSRRAAYVTGHVLYVDGGRTLD